MGPQDHDDCSSRTRNFCLLAPVGMHYNFYLTIPVDQQKSPPHMPSVAAIWSKSTTLYGEMHEQKVEALLLTISII
jgi:hypothetical protein